MFKIGDKVTGESHSPYCYTTNKAVMVVVDTYQGTNIIKVKVLSHEVYSNVVGEVYQVNPDHFIKISTFKGN